MYREFIGEFISTIYYNGAAIRPIIIRFNSLTMIFHVLIVLDNVSRYIRTRFHLLVVEEACTWLAQRCTILD